MSAGARVERKTVVRTVSSALEISLSFEEQLQAFQTSFVQF